MRADRETRFLVQR